MHDYDPHIIPDQTAALMESCVVDITLPHWSQETMIVLYTQSKEQEPNERLKSHRQLLCPRGIGARVMYALMSWLRCLAACTTLVVTVKADRETTYSTDCCYIAR